MIVLYILSHSINFDQFLPKVKPPYIRRTFQIHNPIKKHIENKKRFILVMPAIILTKKRIPAEKREKITNHIPHVLNHNCVFLNCSSEIKDSNGFFNHSILIFS